MGVIKNLKRNAIIAVHSLFSGLASADNIIESQVSNGDGVEIRQQVNGGGGVLNEMLQGQETQRVVEMRDKYYRILKEADKYQIQLSGLVKDTTSIDDFENMSLEDATNPLKDPSFGQEIAATATKKVKSDFMKHSPVYEEEGYRLRVIQDNKKFQKHNNFDCVIPTGVTDYDTTLTVERDGFMPRIEIDKFVSKMVVRQKDDTDRAMVDFYLPTEASQFGKLDAILISNIFGMMESQNFRSDLTDFKTIEWYSDKAWNSEDVAHFKYDDPHLISINVFDGNFVLTFDSHIVEDGKDLTEKYKTKELDEKYASNAPKSDTIDLFTMKRHIEADDKKDKDIDLDNLGNTTLNLS